MFEAAFNLETSVFCDYTYLSRRETIVAVAYESGLEGDSRAVPAARVRDLTSSPRDALVGLAQSTVAGNMDGGSTRSADRRRGEAPGPRRAVRGPRSRGRLSSLVPALHEIGHIEQGYCGRGITTRKEDEDFLANMMLTGEVRLGNGAPGLRDDDLLEPCEERAGRQSAERGYVRGIEEEAPKAVSDDARA